ncbi:anti-sigma factor antagonist [Saccharothrix yanglingensis]|uniref:Anti-sigma factor antagonist n=1 Tax=Saccharothrix yanglingensis TaxID=659496 RepID=A0ABU0X8C1_9PSEU|nr:hypothetical protein [Saccharothrix yanglingensis]
MRRRLAGCALMDIDSGAGLVTVRWTASGDVPVLRVAGEIDAGSIEVVRYESSAWLEEATSDLVLDLDGVTFLASPGLALVVQAAEHARRCGAAFVVAAGHRAVLRPLQATGLDKVFDIRPDRDQAVAAVRDTTLPLVDTSSSNPVVGAEQAARGRVRGRHSSGRILRAEAVPVTASRAAWVSSSQHSGRPACSVSRSCYRHTSRRRRLRRPTRPDAAAAMCESDIGRRSVGPRRGVKPIPSETTRRTPSHQPSTADAWTQQGAVFMDEHVVGVGRDQRGGRYARHAGRRPPRSVGQHRSCPARLRAPGRPDGSNPYRASPRTWARSSDGRP